MILYDKKEVGKYWYPENYKKRLRSNEGSAEVYKSLKEKLKKAVKNRKDKGIPL